MSFKQGAINEKKQSLESSYSPKQPTSFEDALERTEYGRFNLALVIVCGGCLLTVQTESLSAAYILPAAHCDLNLNSADQGLLTSACFIGLIVSAHLWGFVADTRGRKNVIIICLLVSFACTLVASFVSQFWLFISLRFLSGFFLACPSATTYAYLGEFHSSRFRGRSILWASIIMSMGLIMLPGVAWYIIPQQWSFELYSGFVYRPWRLFMVLFGLPSFIFAIMLLPFPESPKFLLLHGRKEDTLAVLKTVFAINTGKGSHNFPVEELAETMTTCDSDTQNGNRRILRQMWMQTVPLFKTPYVFNTVLLGFIQCGLFAASTGLFMWFPEIVNRIALSSDTGATVCQLLSPNINIDVNSTRSISTETECVDIVDPTVFQVNLFIGAGYTLGYFLIGILINALGVRIILVFCGLISGISGVILYLVVDAIIIQILFVIMLVISGVAVCVVSVAVVDLFPTCLRSMSVCISLMVGRTGSVIASSNVGIMLDLNCDLTFMTFSGILLACGILSLLIPKETSKCVQ